MIPVMPKDPFPFLSADRIHAIKSGVQSCNQDFISLRDERLHLFQHMSAWHKGIFQRPLVVAHITESLTDDGYAERYEIGNMQGILFDRKHFCRFFKMHCILDNSCVGSDRIGRETVTFRNARELPAPRLLFPQDALDDGLVPHLAYLTRNDIGYYMRRSQVVELYFLNQDGQKLRAMRQLGLMDSDHPFAAKESA